LGVELALSRAEAATACTVNIQSVIESTRKALQCTVDCMVKNVETSRSETPEYSVGQELTEKWIEPYQIVALKPNAVEL
ncbi:hypothetical protein PISMIDRAFT_119041, partial [Pisolithus microcarpus 441]